MPDTRLAVDTNLLMDFAQPKDGALDALEIIRRRLRGAQILVVPRVLKEIAHKSLHASDAKTRERARKAMLGMEAWGLRTIGMTDLQNTIARSVADKLLAQEIIPPDERGDALILAEAAVLDCQVLLSSDSHLRDADRARVALALQACGVPVVVVCTPREIVRQFGARG